MQSLVICSAAADQTIACKIRHSLEVNCPSIALQENALISSPSELLETVDLALSAEIVLLLLSPDVIPTTWSRQQWEPVLMQQPRELHTALAFVLVRPCRFPEIFRKQRFFDVSTDLAIGLGKLRRWLIEQNPLKQERIELLPPLPHGAPERLSNLEHLVDEPGTARDIPRDSALVFAHTHTRDFEGVFWLGCAGRSRAGVIGDTAHALGLPLTGPTDQNVAALREFCAGLRCLFVFDTLAAEHRELMTFNGRPSVIFTTGSQQQFSVLPLVETVELFARWRTDPEPCLRHLRDAERCFQILEQDHSAETVQLVKDLGAQMFGLLRQHNRLAEAYDVLDFLSKLAWNEGNAGDLRRWEWEKIWIRDEWGHAASAPLRLGTVAEPEQLSLGF